MKTRLMALIMALVGLMVTSELLSQPDGSARLQYEPHFEQGGNYELPPVLINFRHSSSATAANSLKDLTYGAPVQLMIPFFHSKTQPINQPGTFPQQETDTLASRWVISATYDNVLTFDASTASEIVLSGNCAASFDQSITSSNFFKNANGTDVHCFDAIRSISTARQPLGQYFWGSNSLPNGPDIQKGSTFFINRKAGTFIGYNPASLPSELPYLVISGLRIWTGPFTAESINLGPTAPLPLTAFGRLLSGPNVIDSNGRWMGGTAVVGGAGPVASTRSTITFDAIHDNAGSAYRMVFRVSEDHSPPSPPTAFNSAWHWLGNLDIDSNNNPIYYDAKMFDNMFYVGGPRVSVDAPSVFNLYEELSKPSGSKTTFPSITFGLSSGRIPRVSLDGAAGVPYPAKFRVSADAAAANMGSGFSGYEWNYLWSNTGSSTTRAELRLTLPGVNSNFLWSEVQSGGLAAESNIYHWQMGENALEGDLDGDGDEDTQDRFLTFAAMPSTQRNSTTNFGKSCTILFKPGPVGLIGQFYNGVSTHRNIVQDSITDSSGFAFALRLPVDPTSIGGLVIQRFHDGPLTKTGNSYLLPVTSLRPAAPWRGDRGGRGWISEAVKIRNLQVEGFTSTLTTSAASQLNLSSNANEPSRLYGQLGMQVFNNGFSGSYYRATSDNFVFISGGPVITMPAARPATVSSDTGWNGTKAALPLGPITIVHDSDNWVSKTIGLKLSFRPNSGLYFMPFDNSVSPQGQSGANTVMVTIDNSNPIQSTVTYTDRVNTSVNSGGSVKMARSIIINMPTGANYDADVPVTISGSLLVTFDPIYENGAGGFPLRLYTYRNQGINGYGHQSIKGNLMLINKDQFNVDAVLNVGGNNTILANLVHADNFNDYPSTLALCSARDRTSTTADLILAAGKPPATRHVSLDAVRLVFQNTFSAGDIFLHLPSQLDSRTGVGTFDSAASGLVRFSGSAGVNFNRVNLQYGTSGRYLKIRREFIASIGNNDDLVITGLRYYPSREPYKSRLIAGYPTAAGVTRLATVTDARVMIRSQTSVSIDRPVLLNPRDSVSADMLNPFPDIYIHHDGRDIRGVSRQDQSGDLRFALPGTSNSLRWSSDFTRVVYYFTTRDTVVGGVPEGLYKFGSDGSFSGPAGVTWITPALARSTVSLYIDSDTFSGNQGGIGVGIRTTSNGKILGIDVVNQWPQGAILQVSGLMVKNLQQSNFQNEQHIDNNLATYADIVNNSATGISNSIQMTGGQFSGLIILGHLAFNWQNNNEFQNFTQEPVYVSGSSISAVTQAFTYDQNAGGNTPDALDTNNNNLNPITIAVHEDTNLDITAADPAGLKRGVTSDGIRLTFPPDNNIRFLTGDSVCAMNNVAIKPLYENIEKVYLIGDPGTLHADYGGFARTAYLRGLYREGTDTTDVFGFINQNTIIRAGFEFRVTGLSVTHFNSGGGTSYTGYAPGRGVGDWRNVEFGRQNKVPGIMLSMSAASNIDAYLYRNSQLGLINLGSSTQSSQSSSSQTPPVEGTSGNLFNACLLTPSAQNLRR